MEVEVVGVVVVVEVVEVVEVKVVEVEVGAAARHLVGAHVLAQPELVARCVEVGDLQREERGEL